MVAEGIKPNVVTCSSLMACDLSAVSAKKLLSWYLDLEYHPDDPLQAAISQYRKAGRLADAFRLVLNYPYLEASRRFLREHECFANVRCERLIRLRMIAGNANYTAGICMHLHGQHEAALAHLQKAEQLAEYGRRKQILRAWLAGDIKDPWEG